MVVEGMPKKGLEINQIVKFMSHCSIWEAAMPQEQSPKPKISPNQGVSKAV